MKRLLPSVTMTLVAVMALTTGCESSETTGTSGDGAVASTAFPLTTSSEDARRHFLLGLHELEWGRPVEARSHMAEAVRLDPEFALAHRFHAFSEPDPERFMASLSRATTHKDAASEAERLMIEMTEAAIRNDAERQLALARQLTEAYPESPRAWLDLAGVLEGMNRITESREAALQAIQVDSTFAPAWIQLGNSYLLSQPTDRARARDAFERAVALAPEEAAPHDFLGDAYRMAGALEQAAAEYTRASELDPSNALALQQRAHVHSFLGNYDRARADYDSAIALGTEGQPASFAVYRSFVNVHEGNPRAAVQELDALLGRIDTMGDPNPRGAKIFVLTSKAEIALHEGMYDVAAAALEQRAELVRANAKAIGTDQARRSTEADVALWQAHLAARRGEYDRGRALVGEAMAQVEPINDPTKNQAAHGVAGLIHLLEGKYEQAVNHYAQGDPNDIYASYHHGLALEGAGRPDEARALYDRVANWRFNALGLALVRRDAAAKVQGS